MTEIKRCPFCGGKPVTHSLSWHATQFAGHMFKEPFWQATCTDCKATIGDFDSREEAIAAWNRRAEHDLTVHFVGDVVQQVQKT